MDEECLVPEIDRPSAFFELSGEQGEPDFEPPVVGIGLGDRAGGVEVQWMDLLLKGGSPGLAAPALWPVVRAVLESLGVAEEALPGVQQLLQRSVEAGETEEIISGGSVG